MPIAGFKDFAACVTAQMRKGASKESAQRICGFIEKQTREAKLDARIKKASK